MSDSFNERCCSCSKEDGTLNVERVIPILDDLLNQERLGEAAELLEYWRGETHREGDCSGELTIASEQMGLYRKMMDAERGLESVERGLELVDHLGIAHTVSGATILLNAATTLKAFGQAERALSLYQQARQVYEAHLAANDPRMGGFWNNYSLALWDLKRYEEAEEALLKAISIMETFQQGKADAAASWTNMADLYEDMGKGPEEIKQCLTKAFVLLVQAKDEQDGYYYYVLSKCAPGFRRFGFTEAADEFDRQVAEYRARA